jgi:predicted GH43/DUF377 family glycosyl hydrolase
MSSAVEEKVQVHRLDLRIEGDPRRVMLRFFWPGAERAGHILRRLEGMSDEQVRRQVEEVLQQFQPRHADLESLLMENAQEAASRLSIDLGGDRFRQLLVGACLSMEYAIEAAALFNPSMVQALDQNGLAEGEVRFLMSMRAVGEGHLSSIVFRRGTLWAQGRLELEAPPTRAHQVRQEPNPEYQKWHLERKLREMHKLSAAAQAVLDALDDTFSYQQLLAALERLRAPNGQGDVEAAHQLVLWLVKSNYKAQLAAEAPINELVLFPVSEAESHGMEDMRLVRFQDDGQVLLCGTYTAFNGNKILPQMMLYRPGDRHAQVVTLMGEFARGKGMALFPRRVNGQYLMLARCDGERNYLLGSDQPDFWDRGTVLNEPEAPWEIVQVGNCGSPIETPRGWLVLTHGVGPLRRYCIGAMLLDLENPSRILARLQGPLIEPQAQETDGYVPNVVYSCGGMLHGDKLFIPYGISDAACGFAWVSLDELLHAMR